MVKEGDTVCPYCGGALRYYDTVKRFVRTTYGRSYWIDMDRYICTSCMTTHRVIPDTLYPYKHYERRIIDGFIEGQLSFFDLEFEDYPADVTVERWKKER